MTLTVPESDHLTKSRRNRTGLTSGSQAVLQLTRELVDELEEGRPRRFSATQRLDCTNTMLCVILDLLSAAEADETLWIGYSRGKNNFVSGGCYWNGESQTPLISYSHYLGCVDFLTKQNLIESRVAHAGFSRYSSRMKTTPLLHSRFHALGLDWTVVSAAKDTPAVIVKDENKKLVNWPDPGNFDLEQAISNLRRINENLSSTFINLNISDKELDHMNEGVIVTPDDDEEGEAYNGTVDFTCRTLRRIFAMSSFSCGGRFYGGWWQGIPSEYRKHIEIDGTVTVELDYATIQPRILYASVGRLPPEDSYILPDWGPKFRPIVKKAFSQLLNSDPSSRNANQWHRFAPALDPEPLPESWPSMGRFERDRQRRQSFLERTGRDYSELISDVLSFHHPIKNDFFSSAWSATQNLDSQIVDRVLIKMLDEPVPLTVLPIHDSFIVRRGGEEQLRRAMIDSFNEVAMTDAKIDRDATVFDPPLGYDGAHIIVADSTLHDEVGTWLMTHSKYHRRTSQWERTWGHID